MNPFDLYGPQFLLFYSMLIAAGGAVTYLFWCSLGKAENSGRPITDPYLIAYLRGGAKEAVKVAAASLAHRRVLKIDGEIIACEAGHSELLKNELEKTILKNCQSGTTLRILIEGHASKIAEKLFHQRLVKEKLLISYTDNQKAELLKIALIGTLILVAAIKIMIAFQRGRHNVMFLILLAVLGIYAHTKIKLWYTPSGSMVLKDLRTLFGRLKNKTTQIMHPSQNNQFAFLIAVFGLSVLPAHEYLFLSAFRPPNSNNSGSGTSCGTSCGSGCGGGGCGGGCGGCGS